MLTANPTGVPPTFVAINGMLSAAPTPAQLPPNPGAMLAMSSNLGPSSILSTPSLTPSPYILPPSAFPQPPNLSCTANPFSSPQFQTPLFPFLTSASPGLLTGGPIISIPSPFSNQLPQFLQSQASVAALGTFPPSISVTSVVNPLGPPQQLIPDMMTMSSMPSNSQPPLSSLILPVSSMNSVSNASLSNITDIPPYSFSSAITTTSDVSVCANPVSGPITVSSTSAAAAYSLSVSSCSGTTATTTSSPNSSHQTSLPEPACVNPSLQSSFRIYKSQPVAPCSGLTPRTNCTNNLLSLESVDFHRDEILDAIDKLRERKARPDFERISCMLKRHRNINPDQTQLCLGRLAAAGAVVCVDYKGNLSYRNPSKWRKTAATSGVTNPSGISQRLVDAVRRLMAGTVYQPNGSAGSDPSLASLLPAPPGPNGGYSLFQIERALKVSDTSVPPSSGVVPPKILPELTGATLRVCLDREALHGKLAKTPDGRYVLDETGERKRLAAVPPVFPPPISNKIPLPPNSLTSSLLCSGSRYGRSSNNTTCIAPAGDLPGRPLAAKHTLSGAVSIAPLGGRAINSSPLLSLSARPVGASRRGRPPGSKARRPTVLSDLSSPPEKKPKLGQVVASTALCLSADLVSRSCSDTTLISSSNGVISSPNSIRPDSSTPMVPTNRNGTCCAATMPLSTPFLTGIAQPNGICPSVLPSSVLPTPFPIPHMGDFPLSHNFGAPFLTFATCPGSSLVPNRLSSQPTDMPILPAASDPMNSPVISVLSDLEAVDLPHTTEEKSDPENPEDVCCYCATPATKEEPFLECSDCRLRAHPTCLDYWPELTERARQSPWQCTDCKVCSVCLNKQLTTELLICDACDKGFHSECHVPKLEEPVDRSLPWVCAECQKEGYSVAIGTMPEGASQQYTIPISKSANNQEESPVKDVGTLSEGSSPDESPHANSQSIAEGKARMPTPQMSDVESTTPSNQYHMGIMKPETDNSPAANSLSSPQARTMEKGSPCKPSMNVVSPIDQSIQSTIPASYELSGGRSWDAAKLAPDVVSAPDSPSSITRAVEDKSNGPESFNSVGTLDVPASRESIQCLIRPLDIRAWTVEHVREWLLEEGFPREAEAFFQQEIDGACLLLMKRMDVLTELGIKLGPGVKIYERIKRLQSRCTSPTMLNA